MTGLPQSVKKSLNTLKKAGFEAYLVGGSVRHLIMGVTTNNWDFTTNATPAHLLKIFPDSFYNNEFGTVGVPVKNKKDETETVFEITTFRTEQGYTDRRHPDEILWGVTLAEDLARRDFTINAIAFDGKNIIDPHDGQKDIARKIIRAVGNPNLRFNEDALRLLRAVRIATQLGFTIEEKTFAAIQAHAHLIKNVSSDRIRAELIKIIASKHAADGIMLLRNAKLIAEIIPELEKAFGVPQKSPKRHHIYDVGTHLLMSLYHCPSIDPITRLATLLHDIGKPVVYRKDEETGIITFYNHEVIGASIVRNISFRLNFSKKDREKLVTLVRWHQFTVDEKQTDGTLRRFVKRVGKENLKDILDLRIGDRLGGGAQETSWRLRLFIGRLEEVQKQPFTVADLKIDGHDVMKTFNISPGKKVGQILNELFNEVVTEKVKNKRENLLKRLEQFKKIGTSA